jgi:hypothetical protein
MRILIRLALLALAAVGAKALYDRFAPRAADLREPVSGVLDTARSAARDVTDHAKDAAVQVADDARTRAGVVRDEARAAGDKIGDTIADPDAPTVAAATS